MVESTIQQEDIKPVDVATEEPTQAQTQEQTKPDDDEELPDLGKLN